MAAIYLVSVVVYSIVALQHPVSDLFPDEMFYAKLSQGFAAGHGLTWRGTSFGIPPVWPIVLSVVWHFGSVPEGYAHAKILGTALASATVVPVWLLAREFVGPRLALLAAALSVTGAWMQSTSYLASENLAYPLATASLACTVMALRRAGTRWICASLAFALVGSATRTQLLVLPVILVLALMLDVARQRKGERRARIEMHPRWLWIGLIALVAGGLLAFVVNPHLTYYDVLAHHAGVGRVAERTGQNALSAVLLVGVIPAAAALALMARGANWRDDEVGPVLSTFVAAALVLLPVVARFEAFATTGPVDRYVMYLAPLAILAMVMAPGRIGRRTALGLAVGLALSLLLVPLAANYIEQPAVFGTEERIQELGRFFDEHIRLGLVLIAVPLAATGTTALAVPPRQRGLAVASAIVAYVMVLQGWTSQRTEIGFLKDSRHLVAPAQLDWVDRRVDSPAAGLDLGKPEGLRANIDLYTEFFNRRVNNVYANVGIGGGGCPITLKGDGSLIAHRLSCLPWPRYLVIEDAPYRATLAGQRVLATTPASGTLVEIPPGTPHVLGLVQPPCTRDDCYSALRLSLFLTRPGRVTATFGAAGGVYRISTDHGAQTLAAGRSNTFAFDVSPEVRNYLLPVNWTTPAGTPPLKSVVLHSGGKTTRLY